MGDPDNESDIKISQDLASFLAECESTGNALALAAEGLIRLAVLPEPALIEDIERLRKSCQSLLERAEDAKSQIGELAERPTRRESRLEHVIGFVREVIVFQEHQSARSAAVLDLLGKVIRIDVNTDDPLPALAEVRSQAVGVLERIQGVTTPGALPEFVDLNNGTHPFCHLITLVEKFDISPEERTESLIEVASLGREVAHAARSRRLIVGTHRPSSGDISDPSKPSGPVRLAEEQTNASAPPREPIQDEPPAQDGITVESPAVFPPPTESHGSRRAERGIHSGVHSRAGGGQVRPFSRGLAFRPKPGADRPFDARNLFLDKSSLSPLDDLIGRNRGPESLDVNILPASPVALSKNVETGLDEIAAPLADSRPASTEIAAPLADSRPASTEKVATLLGNFPEDLRDFAAFQKTHWIDSKGECNASPWTRPDFVSELRFHAISSLNQPGRLIIFSRAAATIGLNSPYEEEDVEALTALLSTPSRAESGKDPRRGQRLLEAIREGTLDDTPAWKLAVTLEAVRPSEEFYPIAEISALFHHDPLKKVFIGLLSLAGRGTARPLEELRSSLHSEAAPTPEQWISRLKTKRETFRRLIDNHRAPGGRLKLSHCRDTWKEFMDEGKKFFDSIYTVTGRDALPDPRTVTAETGRLRGRYKTIADRGAVKYEERRRMDRMVETILNEADEIGELAGQVRANGEPKKAAIDSALCEAVANLAESEAPEDLTEIGCLHLLRMLLEDHSGAGERRFTDLMVGDLAAHPGLVSMVPSEAAAEIVAGATADEPVCRYDELSAPLTAAALLLEDPSGAANMPDSLSGQQLSEMLQNQPERLVRLPKLLSGPQRAAVRRDINCLRDKAQERVNRLKVVRIALDALVSRWSNPVGQIYEKGQALIDDAATEEFALALGWLDHALSAARQRLDAEVTQLAGRVEGTLQGEARERARRAVAEAQYSDVLQILGDPDAESRDDGRRLRETSYRKISQERFHDPARTLAGSTDPATAELRANWRTGINGQDDRKFRNDFLRFLCSKRSKRKATTSLEKEARFDNQDCRLSTHAIRERIAEFGLNPCYLPQLADFKELIILVPPTKVLSAKFVKATADEVARRGPGALCAVLAPAVTSAARDALLKEFRDRKRVAAVIDDLDFCRLLNPGGESPDPLIGFFEIFLEQQRWETLSPYNSGRLVEKEMFVGRLDEAGDLKRTNKYSRLFSGRKLGKTSLLNHVLQTSGDDAERMPSGNVLRVLLITSVGPDAREVVDEVRAQMATRLGLQLSSFSTTDDPADDLVALTDAFVAERPDESLLVIIDEADSLFEKELELYESKLERGLSFRMSREVERKHLDSEGLPRIRFLFSGYRVTNKSEGVWANWGDVLRLTPLEPQDAGQPSCRPPGANGYRSGQPNSRGLITMWLPAGSSAAVRARIARASGPNTLTVAT